MKKYLISGALLVFMSCGPADLEPQYLGSGKQEDPNALPEVVRNNDAQPVCECNGEACFCMEPGATIIYRKTKEETVID